MATPITTAIAAKKENIERKDLLALWIGIAFSALFTGLIWLTGDALKVFPHLPDQGPSWYYWKLSAPTVVTRLSVWGLYAAHQIASWWTIWHAQNSVKKYTTGLHPINIIALGMNAAFILLHFIQTHVWYDGLAQDVSIYSSQGSVIVLLIWVLLMENNRRGLFFGQKLPISQRVIRFARKYHGYFFSWAIIYTFWYHPMENTGGHLVGFFYMFLLLLQGSLFFTRIHVNRYWTFVQELLVLFHGTMVAIVNGNNLWPMFFFGFAGIFIITQMHGLGLNRWTRAALLALYVAGMVLIYSGRGVKRLWEPTAIPLIDYLGVIVLALLFALILFISDRFSPRSTPTLVANSTTVQKEP